MLCTSQRLITILVWSQVCVTYVHLFPPSIHVLLSRSVQCFTRVVLPLQDDMPLVPLLQHSGIKMSSALSVRVPECQNDVLTQSGRGCFIAVPIWQQAFSSS